MGFWTDSIFKWQKEKFWRKGTGANPAQNPAKNWQDCRPDCPGEKLQSGFAFCPVSSQESGQIRPDSAVPGTIHVVSDFHFFYFVILACLSTLLIFWNVLDRVYLLISPGESWAGSPLTPLVRLRGRWGCHTEDDFY